MTSDAMAANGSIEKVSIIVSKGSLEGVYPALIMANGARAEGIEANLFFTFFGLDAIHKARHEHIKLATVGNPGLHLARSSSHRQQLTPESSRFVSRLFPGRWRLSAPCVASSWFPRAWPGICARHQLFSWPGASESRIGAL